MTNPTKQTSRRAPTQTKSTATAKRAPAKTAKPVPVASRKREKLIRDSFTIPKDEYAVLGDLKQRALDLKHAAKKSELLRAGVKALAALKDADFLAALHDVPAIKTGRPAAATPKVHKDKQDGADKH